MLGPHEHQRQLSVALQEAKQFSKSDYAQRHPAGALGKMVGRYALLAVLAYVMIARLRLHPVGLVVGASSLVVAATVEAARWLARPTPRATR